MDAYFDNLYGIVKFVLHHNVHCLVGYAAHVDAYDLLGLAVVCAKHGEDTGATAKVQDSLPTYRIHVFGHSITVRFRSNLVRQHLVMDAEMGWKGKLK